MEKLHTVSKNKIRSTALGLEFWFCPLLTLPSRGFCHLIRLKSWFCHENIIVFPSNEPKLIRVHCHNQDLPPSTPKCTGLKNVTALSNNHLYLGERSGWHSKSAPCSDSVVQAPSFLVLFHPLGYCLDSTHGRQQMVNTKIRLILFFAANMDKLYTVSKNKTRSWLWLRSWTPYCQIQT